ncbi:MAG: hypothetical protein IKG75_00920 [Bacteroidaceae bacterium]|nr:hypothetical protein [Bacteroidaceae bacterium]
MRKILFLFGLMLAFGVSTALAALPITELEVSTTGNEKTFYLKNNGTGSAGEYFLSTITGATMDASEYGKFAFYAVSGVDNAYYIKECTTNKWLTYDETAIDNGKDFVKLSDTQGNYFNVTKNNLYYWIRPVNTSGSPTNYCNWNGGPNTYNATNTLGLWNSYDDKGSQWIFVEPESVVTSLEAISDDKCYFLNVSRGGIFANTDGTSIVPINNSSASTAAGADKWALIPYNGKYCIYNPTLQKFLRKDATLSNIADIFTLTLSTGPVGLFKFALSCDGNTLNHNGSIFVINSYGTPDPGNIIMICEAGTFDKTSVDATAAVLAGMKENALAKVAPFSFLVCYPDVVSAINAATSEAELNAAMTNAWSSFNNKFFTAKNVSTGKYLEVGDANASFNASPTDHSNYIQLVSAGDGEFYLKGYKSQRYISDVAVSTAITTEETPTYPFFIQKVNGNWAMRPVKWADSGYSNGYHYIHAGGSGCVGWASGNENSQYTLVEVADPDAEVNVTYALYYLNEKIKEVATTSGVGLSPVAPDAFVRDFVDLAVENTTITTANQTIRVDATWTGPFELNADYASIAKWYDMSIRNTWYVTSDNKDGDGALKTVNANAMGLAEDAYQWAFVGNPYNIKLYNKAEGSTKAFAWTSTDDGSIPAFVDAATANSWWVRKSTASDQATYSNAFLLTVPDYGWQVNQFGGSGGSLKVWRSDGTHDAGSAFKVFDVPDDFSEYAVAEILPYLEASGYYALTDAAKAEIGWDDSYSTSCPFAAYKAMKQTLQAKLADGSGVKKPGTGYYRLQSKYYPGKYMSYRIFDDNGTVAHSICAVDNSSDITSIVKLTSLGSNKYTLSIEGAYVPVPKTSTKMELADAPVEFTAISSYIGAAAFNTNNQEEDRDRAIHCASTQDYYCVGWTYNAEASEWTLDDATTFSITMHAGESSYWATLNAPFGVELPDGTEAFVGIRDGGNLVLTSIGTNVPANTPVVLKGNAASITATINDEIPAINIANDLQGQNLSQTGENESLLSLGIYDGVVGFYQYEGIIGANKAYLNNTAGSGANGFKFVFADEDPTAVNGVKAASEAATYFDLFGRKVVAPAKGNLYIQNGKVVKY